jgi:hypothetical protein
MLGAAQPESCVEGALTPKGHLLIAVGLTHTTEILTDIFLVQVLARCDSCQAPPSGQFYIVPGAELPCMQPKEFQEAGSNGRILQAVTKHCCRSSTSHCHCGIGESGI